jgi:hypothetical protein
MAKEHSSQNKILEFCVKVLLKYLDQALTLLICIMEETDCNLGGTFVNLAGFGDICQSLGG